MDWKYKHFTQEAVFQAEREPVVEAARAFAAEALAGWKISDTADGFEARGRSAGHETTAKVQIEPAPGGTKVAVTLLVERASALGFMLVDIAVTTTVRFASGWRASTSIFTTGPNPQTNRKRWNKGNKRLPKAPALSVSSWAAYSPLSSSSSPFTPSLPL